MFLNNEDLILVARLVARDGHPLGAELAKKILDLLTRRIEEADKVINDSIELKETMHDARLAILETIPND